MMVRPQLIVVAGCNAAGKSSFIRSRISQLQDFAVIMTDVYKGRTREVFRQAIKDGTNIIFETVFNDASFRDWIDDARTAGYYTSLIVLFLDTPKHSIERVANRSIEENGLRISGNNIQLNFNESFKNIAQYYFYFEQSDFIYTGITGKNELIMRFKGQTLTTYTPTDLEYPQKFADYAH
jgi:predicted ABC-type ATPase